MVCSILPAADLLIWHTELLVWLTAEAELRKRHRQGSGYPRPLRAKTWPKTILKATKEKLAISAEDLA